MPAIEKDDIVGRPCFVSIILFFTLKERRQNMRYYIIDLVLMKLYPYHNLDDLIKLLGTETEIIIPVEESVENIIFNPKVFDSEKKLYALKQTIGNFISINPI